MRFVRLRCFAVFALGLFGWFAAAGPAPDLAREMILAPQAGAAREDAEIRRWQARAARAEATRADYERLGWAFIAKARRTLDAGCYKLAEKTANVIEAGFGAAADSRLLRGHALHNLHRFREAETIARQLVAERGEPEDFALLSDALMEQGRLTAAIEALQRMANLKPGLEASARIAHARWLRGDLPGASAAMEDAVRAADPREGETLAWALVRLSGFRLQTGDASGALVLADAADQHAADFAPAWLARGRALRALGRNADAIVALRRAAELNPLPEYQWWLADALRAEGRDAEAEPVERAIVDRGAATDSRTLALFLATHGRDAALAVRLAREELANRADVFTHDALAWALAASGDFAAAEPEMRAALAEHTRDARLFFHAAVIARATGREAAAEDFAGRARPLAATLAPSERAVIFHLIDPHESQ